MNKKAISPVVASALLLVVAVVAVVGFQTWFSGFSSGVFTKTELQSNSDESIQIEKIIGNTVYLKNSKNTTISLSKLKVGSIDCNVNQNLSYGVTGIDISSCLAQISDKSQNVVAYTDKAVVSKDVYISDWDSTTPYLSLSSNWTTIPYNTSVNLSWSGNNLNTCLASGAWSGSKSTSNSEVISNLITNSTFTLDCTSNTVNVSKSVEVVVTDLPIITFSAENSSIPFNSSTNLVWSVANADTCIASGNWSGSKATSGTYNTSNLDISGNHSYTLTCNGFGGQSSSTVIVNVKYLDSCKSIFNLGYSNGNGVYIIDPDSDGPINYFNVYCDMTNNGGGWTLVMFNENNAKSFPLIQDNIRDNLTQLKSGNINLSYFLNGSRELMWKIENNVVIIAQENSNVFDIQTYYPIKYSAVHGGSFNTAYRYVWSYSYIDPGFSNTHCSWSYSSGNAGWYDCGNLYNYYAYGDCGPCSQPYLSLFGNGRSGYFSWGSTYDADSLSLDSSYNFIDIKPAFVNSMSMNSSLWIR